MPPFRNQTSSVYELFAVIAHTGDMEKGKFISYVKVGRPYSSWLLFDEERVEKVSEFEVRSLKGSGANAATASLNGAVSYLMFYRSFDPDNHGFPPRLTMESSSRYNFSSGSGDTFGGRNIGRSCGGGGGG